MTTSDRSAPQVFLAQDTGRRVMRPEIKRRLGMRKLGVVLLAATLATGCVSHRAPVGPEGPVGRDGEEGAPEATDLDLKGHRDWLSIWLHSVPSGSVR